MSKKKLTKLEKFIVNISWKPILIDNRITDYEVSDIGFIRNIKTGRMLSGSHDSRGYKTVSIYLGKKLYTKKVHRLVAEAFIPNPENKPTVNHKDGNKENNDITNLEWATHQENIDHAIKTGLRDINGINAVSNIYTENQVHQVCKLLEKGKSARYISEKLNVNINLPRRILYLNKWKEISSLYKLPEVSKYHPNIKGKTFDLLNKGISSHDDIIRILKLPNDNKTRRYITNVKVQYNKINRSSTSSSNVE